MIKRNSKLIHFLITGCLDILEIGALQADVFISLGNPEDIDINNENNQNELHSYYDRSLQICYYRNKISYYGIYFRYLNSESMSIVIKNVVFPNRKSITPTKLQFFLQSENIFYERNKQLSIDDTFALNIGSNIIAIFCDEIIDSFQVTNFQ